MLVAQDQRGGLNWDTRLFRLQHQGGASDILACIGYVHRPGERRLKKDLHWPLLFFVPVQYSRSFAQYASSDFGLLCLTEARRARTYPSARLPLETNVAIPTQLGGAPFQVSRKLKLDRQSAIAGRISREMRPLNMDTGAAWETSLEFYQIKCRGCGHDHHESHGALRNRRRFGFSSGTRRPVPARPSPTNASRSSWPHLAKATNFQA